MLVLLALGEESMVRGTCKVSSMLLGAQVEPDDLGNLKDSMEHYLQDAAEPDFVEAGPLLHTLHASVHRHLLGQPCAFCFGCLCKLQVSESMLGPAAVRAGACARLGWRAGHPDV